MNYTYTIARRGDDLVITDDMTGRVMVSGTWQKVTAWMLGATCWNDDTINAIVADAWAPGTGIASITFPAS